MDNTQTFQPPPPGWDKAVAAWLETMQQANQAARSAQEANEAAKQVSLEAAAYWEAQREMAQAEHDLRMLQLKAQVDRLVASLPG